MNIGRAPVPRVRAPLPALNRARELLLGTDAGAPAVGELARAAGSSATRFIRRYAAVFGETPHRQRTRARLERAKALLAGGSSVIDACLDTGFASVGSFSTLFRRHVGVPPMVYRAQARGRASLPADHPRSLRPGCLNLMERAFAEAAGRNFRDARPPASAQTAGNDNT